MPDRLKTLIVMTGFLVILNTIMTDAQVVPSAWNTERYLRILHEKKVGIVANSTSLIGKVNIV